MTAPTIAAPGGETGTEPPPPARATSATVDERAALLLHDARPHDVVVELLRQLDEERAGTYTVEYMVGRGFPWQRVHPRADRARAAAEARRTGVPLEVSIVRRSPWRPAE